MKSKEKRLSYIELALSPNDRLEEIMKSGTIPDTRDLCGWEFRGYNTLDLTGILGFRKFKKGFFSEIEPKSPTDRIKGYNLKVIQNGIIDDWIDTGAPRYAFYEVYPAKDDPIDNKYQNAILINYGLSDKNPKYDPSRVLRDYLVQVYPDNKDLFLGKAYVAIGKARIFVSYFVLERNNRNT
ncbi:MAG: hypothetical protein N2746_07540 [Deltaproteobacteria bacterium]|nr:hypothetical protein [Deltaproteobacteria bacterium]